MNVKIRGEFIRVANAFTYGKTGVYASTTAKSKKLNGIYVRPHPTKDGVQIVSTDGGAMCVQHDEMGSVPYPVIIEHLDKDTLFELSNGPLSSRWFIFEDGSADIGTGAGAEPMLADVSATVTADRGDFPDWERVLPSESDIGKLEPGFPGFINVAYMGTMSRLWQDGLANARTVKIWHDPEKGLSGNTVWQFPWRNHALVVIAPMTINSGMPCKADLFHLVEGGESDDL